METKFKGAKAGLKTGLSSRWLHGRPPPEEMFDRKEDGGRKSSPLSFHIESCFPSISKQDFIKAIAHAETRDAMKIWRLQRKNLKEIQQLTSEPHGKLKNPCLKISWFGEPRFPIWLCGMGSISPSCPSLQGDRRMWYTTASARLFPLTPTNLFNN